MAIALTVLKIIGITILAILALILVLAAIILFVPIRYKIAGNMEKDGDPYARAGVSFLLHILSGSFVYDKDVSYSVRLFGIKLYPKKDKGKKAEPVTTYETATAEETSKPDHIHEAVQQEDISEDIPGADDYTIDWNEDPFHEEDHTDAEKGRIEAFIEKLVSKYESLSAKYEKIRKDIRFWDRMINDTRNRDAFDLIKSKVIRLLKKIAPRKISGYVHFGSDDPATLGKILVFLSIIYPTLPRKLRLEPDFENADIYGDIKIKGHFSLITPVAYFVRIYFDKDCRRMWRLYKKHSQRS